MSDKHQTDPELDTLSQIEQQGSRFRKGQPPKDQAPPLSGDDMLEKALDENVRSAWGQPGAYEVP